MINTRKLKALRLLAFILPAAICSYAGIQVINKSNYAPPLSAQDSLLNRLQQYIDTSYSQIAGYCKAESEQSLYSYQTTLNNNRSKQITDSLNKVISIDYPGLCSKNAAASQEEKIQAVKGLYEKINHFETAEKQLKTDNDWKHNQINILRSQLSKDEKKYSIIKDSIARLTSPLKGPGVIKIDKNEYRFFITSTKDHNIYIHNSKGGPASIETLRKETAKGTTPLMITNGGMFMPGYAPQGLLIEDGQMKHALDTQQLPNNGNFYLQPNGVFYIDANGKYHIENTQDFCKTLKGKTKLQFATQSGPLLNDNNVINRNFKAGSENTNIRSGVGIIDNDHAVFIISDAKVNFFEFTLLFREIFRCKNALYLDGAISQMYIHENFARKQNRPIDGAFGPLISITPKRKI